MEEVVLETMALPEEVIFNGKGAAGVKPDPLPRKEETFGRRGTKMGP